MGIRRRIAHAGPSPDILDVFAGLEPDGDQEGCVLPCRSWVTADAAFAGLTWKTPNPRSDEVKDAAYAFLSFMSQPAQANEDVTIGASGFNPYRVAQFENVEPWLEAGFTEEGAANYLGAIQDSLNSPNMALDLRIPQNARYQQVILDTVISQLLAGEFTPEEAAQEIFDQWEEVTERAGP